MQFKTKQNISTFRNVINIFRNERKCVLCSIAEVVEWLTPSTAVREVAGSIPAKGMFSEKYLRLELSNVQIHGYQKSERQTKKVRKANQKQSVGATINGCPVYL